MKRKELLEKYDRLIDGYYNLLGEMNIQKKELDSIVTENPDDSTQKKFINYLLSDEYKSHIKEQIDELEGDYIGLKKPVTGWLDAYILGASIEFQLNFYEGYLKYHKWGMRNIKKFIEKNKKQLNLPFDSSPSSDPSFRMV